MKSMLERRKNGLRYYVYPGYIKSYYLTNFNSVVDWLNGIVNPDFKIIYDSHVGYTDISISWKNDKGEDVVQELMTWNTDQKDYICVPHAWCRKDLF